MNLKELLEELREKYKSYIPLFTKEDEDYQCLKTYRKGRLHGIFTRDYYKRKRLFKEGIITLGYIFKSYQSSFNSEEDFPVWLLWAPKSKFIDNPNLYLEIVNKINEFIDSKPKNRKERHLYNILVGELSEPKYIELPLELTNNELVYLSSTYVRQTHTSSFTLGLTPLILSLTLTKEIMILPDAYLTLNWKKYKEKKENEND